MYVLCTWEINCVGVFLNGSSGSVILSKNDNGYGVLYMVVLDACLSVWLGTVLYIEKDYGTKFQR